MTQLQMFDPRLAPTATAVMLEDVGLRSAIDIICARDDGWPYVEHLCEIDGRPAWLVDDCGARFVVVNGFIWYPDELAMAVPRLRAAAMAAIARLEAFETEEKAA
ncbi:MAG TPA: hypothetical protein VG222_14015 [Vicinamibacterales bacterium]|nr:hypothetical protein [Vicinamibacterales bacterium]